MKHKMFQNRIQEFKVEFVKFLTSKLLLDL